MDFYDEQDYLMRIIKELARVLFTLMFGRKYTQVEFPAENKYEVSGIPLSDLTELVDCGDVNKAENMLLTNINYTDKEEVAAAALFYQYVGKKGADFLTQHQYSEEEVLDGLNQLAKKAGYDNICNILL